MPFWRCLISAVSCRDVTGCLSLAQVGKNSKCKMKLRTLLCTGDTDELEPTAGVNKQWDLSNEWRKWVLTAELWDQLYNLPLGKERALVIKRVFLGSRVMQNLTNLKQTAELRPNTPHKGVKRQDLCLKTELYTIHPSKYSAKETGDTLEHPSPHIKQKVWRPLQKDFLGPEQKRNLFAHPGASKES